MVTYEMWERFGWKLGSSGSGDPGVMRIAFDFVESRMRFKSSAEADTLHRSVLGLDGWTWRLGDDLAGSLVDPAGNSRLRFDLLHPDAFESFLLWAAVYDMRLAEGAVAATGLPPFGDLPGMPLRADPASEHVESA